MGNKQAVVALVILFLLILLGKGISFIGSLSKPSDPNLAVGKQSSLNEKTSFNILFLGQDKKTPLITLLNYNPKNQKATILHITNQIYANMPKDLGVWPVGSIYRLGEEENPPRGALLVKLSVAKLLGMPVDGIIIQNKSEALETTIANLRSNPLSIPFFSSQLKTDLTPLEVFKMLFTLSKVRGDRVTSLDLEKSSITESKLLPDASRVLGVNTVKLDVFIRENIFDPNLVDEGVSIAVFNATSHSGLAQEATRVITNLGGNVIKTDNSDVLQEKSFIIFANPQDEKITRSITAQRLGEVFAPICLKNTCAIVDPKVGESRAQINIVLGEDYFTFWHRR